VSGNAALVFDVCHARLELLEGEKLAKGGNGDADQMTEPGSFYIFNMQAKIK